MKKSSSYFNLFLIWFLYNLAFTGIYGWQDDANRILSYNEEAVMKCYRCNGAMVYEKFYGEGGEFFGWRCIVCGEIIDRVILKNRYGKE